MCSSSCNNRLTNSMGCILLVGFATLLILAFEGNDILGTGLAKVLSSKKNLLLSERQHNIEGETNINAGHDQQLSIATTLPNYSLTDDTQISYVNFCKSALLAPRNQTKQPGKYVVYYPRAGLGNIIMGYTSAVMYACATGRTLKIAPSQRIWPLSPREYFECSHLFGQEMCQGLEMDEPLAHRYINSSKTTMQVLTPEAWEPQHCQQNYDALAEILCQDGMGHEEDEFVSISSCQYYGGLLRANPHFKQLFPPTPYQNIVRAKLRPSPEVAEQMTRPKKEEGEQFDICLHVRFDAATTEQNNPHWLQSLQSCASSLAASTSNESQSSPLLLFTMYPDVRSLIPQVLANSTTLSHLQVQFASETNVDGGRIAGNSNDPIAAVADMFSMATACRTLLVTHERSTYIRLAQSIAGNRLKVLPVRLWGDNCSSLEPLSSDLEPEGGMWVPTDHCGLRNYNCSA